MTLLGNEGRRLRIEYMSKLYTTSTNRASTHEDCMRVEDCPLHLKIISFVIRHLSIEIMNVNKSVLS